MIGKEKLLERKGTYKELVELSGELETNINRVMNVVGYNMKPSPQSLMRVNETAQAIINRIWSFSKEYYEEEEKAKEYKIRELEKKREKIEERIKSGEDRLEAKKQELDEKIRELKKESELRELRNGIREIKKSIKNAWKNMGSASARRIAFKMKPYQDLLKKVTSFLNSTNKKANQKMKGNLIKEIHNSIGIEVGPYRKERGKGKNL